MTLLRRSRLPVGHCELNPIELIWAQVKGEVAKTNTAPSQWLPSRDMCRLRWTMSRPTTGQKRVTMSKELRGTSGRQMEWWSTCRKLLWSILGQMKQKRAARRASPRNLTRNDGTNFFFCIITSLNVDCSGFFKFELYNIELYESFKIR